MDLRDKKHTVCVLNAAGDVVEQTAVAATPETVAKFFQRYRGAVVAMETGTPSRWVSRLATAAGLEALVGNARKLRAIWANEKKSDLRDAELLARLARADRRLLYPVHHRAEATQARLVLIQARDGLVSARSALINQVRSLVKGFGARLRACSAECFHKQTLPEAGATTLAPVMTAIEQLTAQIRHYDHEVAAQVAAQPTVQTHHAPRLQRLQPVDDFFVPLAVRKGHELDVEVGLLLTPRYVEP
jgi:transposase